MQIKLQPLRQIKNKFIQVYLVWNLTFEILALKHKSHMFIIWRFCATAALTLDSIWLVHIWVQVSEVFMPVWYITAHPH